MTSVAAAQPKIRKRRVTAARPSQVSRPTRASSAPLEGKDALDLLGLSPAAARILRYFLIRPTANPHGRELQRVLELGGASLQRELRRLLALGMLRCERSGRYTRYCADHRSPLWNAVRIIAAASRSPGVLVENALADVGVDAAFVFGSYASGTATEESDVDVLIIEGKHTDRKKLRRHMGELQLVLDREVDALYYSPQKLAERLGDSSHPASSFVRSTLRGPKFWVAGSPEAVQPIATAAGVSLGEFRNAKA